MKKILKIIYTISLPVFIVGSMLNLGLSLTFKDILKPLKNIKLVLMALVLNFIVVPIITVGIINIMNIDEGVKIALIVLSLSAGAPFLPKLAEISKADIGESIGIMILLMVGTIFYLPIILPVIMEGVSINPLEIAQSLIKLMLIPLFGALIFHSKMKEASKKLAILTKKISNYALLLLTITLITLNFKSVLSLFGLNLLALTLFILLAIFSGYLLGGKNKTILSLSNGQRNISAAMIVLTQNFSELPTAIVAVVVMAIYGLVIMFPIAKLLSGNKPNILIKI